MASDAAGNVYVAGYFSGTLVLSSITLTGRGSSDAFVAKWSPATNSFVWVQPFGNIGQDEAFAITVSGNSVYVAGDFSTSVAFGTTTLTSVGLTDCFVAKVVDAGTSSTVAWAQRMGGVGFDASVALAVNGASVYVGGSFTNGAADFGPYTVANLGNTDGFVTKLADAGTTASFAWAQGLGGTVSDRVLGLAVAGNMVYATGYFNALAMFGSTSLTSLGRSDVFVAKLADAGATVSFAWVQRAGGTDDEQGRALVVNGTQVYVTGVFYGLATFGTTVLASAGLEDVFVAKLTDGGASATHAWAQRLGGGGIDWGSAIALNSGSIYVAGAFTGTSVIGPNILPSAGSYDGFVARLAETATSATVVWGQQLGGVQFDQAQGLVISGSRLYVAGTISPPATFGPFTIPVGIGTNNQFGFLATLGSAALGATPATALGAISFFPNPAHGMVTVQLPSITGPATLTLLDAIGRPVRRFTTANSQTTLDLTGLAPGLYAVRKAAGGSTATRRLVVE
ncbi:hypothetical protein GCM10028822_20250 [Hymenobacter terrigena]